MPEHAIAKLEPADLGWALALNNDAVPHVNAHVAEGFERLVEGCELPLGVRLRGASGGFLIAFGPGASYESPNYRWFAGRFADFLYVDRIVVSPGARGAGLGRALYDAVFAAAGRRPVCCEVNLRPPNPGSLAFHARLGLFEVGRQETDGGAKEVALLASAPLPSGL